MLFACGAAVEFLTQRRRGGRFRAAFVRLPQPTGLRLGARLVLQSDWCCAGCARPLCGEIPPASDAGCAGAQTKPFPSASEEGKSPAGAKGNGAQANGGEIEIAPAGAGPSRPLKAGPGLYRSLWASLLLTCNPAIQVLAPSHLRAQSPWPP